MGQPRSQHRRRTGILPAVLLWFVAALAAAYGPLTASRPLGIEASSSARSASVPAQHSAPATQERSYIATEWRGGRWADDQYDGANDGGLPPADAALAVPPLSRAEEAPAVQAFSGALPDAYQARAPPRSA